MSTASAITLESIRDSIASLPKAEPAFDIWCTPAFMDAIKAKFTHLSDPSIEAIPGVQIIACLPPESPKHFIKVPRGARHRITNLLRGVPA